MNTRSLPWIVSAPFDLCFLANLSWPLLLLPGFSSGSDTVIDFWQVYYLTLPHRWITLILVAIDRDRREHKSMLLVSLALLIAAVVLGTYFGSGAFLCLGVVDYVWNGWHFASQHAGVLRIYSRKENGGHAWLERHGLRVFIVYVILRTAGNLLWRSDNGILSERIISLVDYSMLVVPLLLIAANLRDWNWNRLPKMVYMMSVLSLYSGYLLTSQFGPSRWIVCLATAASLFHAVEYLAVVSYYAKRREETGSSGLMRRVGTHWMLCFSVFVLSLGTIGWSMSNASQNYDVIWQGLNLWAAFTHYAFDGIIWKLRRPQTANALGVG